MGGTSQHHAVATEMTAMAGQCLLEHQGDHMETAMLETKTYTGGGGFWGSKHLHLIKSEYKTKQAPVDPRVIPGELLTHRHIGQISPSSKCLGWGVPNYFKIFMLLND